MGDEAFSYNVVIVSWGGGRLAFCQGNCKYSNGNHKNTLKIASFRINFIKIYSKTC